MAKKRKNQAKQPKPLKPLMLRCHCSALYNARLQWYTGYRVRGDTSGDFYWNGGSVKPGHCPICREPPINLLPGIDAPRPRMCM